MHGSRPKNSLDLARVRRQVPWVDDDDLDDLEARSTTGATLLGLFTWGGGRLMVGDRKAGVLGIAALIGWIAMAGTVPAGVGALVYWLVGGGFAAWSYDGARKVRRFENLRNQLALRAGPTPEAYRLLTAASIADPSLARALPAAAPEAAPTSHAPIVEQVRRLAALHRSGVLTDHELAERKVDLFSANPPASRQDLDDLLFALLPLRDQGMVSDDDIAFLKGLSR